MLQILPIARLHPNENVYFNFLIGGLKGAKEFNIPYWGNSFGNAYYQAVKWVNENAKEGDKLALVQGTATNVPVVYVDKKVRYGNNYWSGPEREGEYLVELTHQGNEIAYRDVWYYVNNILEPVYEVKVDGVAIAKVWKNDAEHARNEYRIERKLAASMRREGRVIEFDLGEERSVLRLVGEFGERKGCSDMADGVVQISRDGESWETMGEKLSSWQISAYPVLEDGVMRYFLYGKKARWVRLTADLDGACWLSPERMELSGVLVRLRKT